MSKKERERARQEAVRLAKVAQVERERARARNIRAVAAASAAYYQEGVAP